MNKNLFFFNFRNVLAGFNTCMNSWLSTNCVAEDKPEVITEVLNDFVNAWCDEANAFKSDLATSKLLLQHSVGLSPFTCH